MDWLLWVMLAFTMLASWAMCYANHILKDTDSDDDMVV